MSKSILPTTVIEVEGARVTVQAPRGKLQVTVERRPAPAREEEDLNRANQRAIEIADAIGQAHGQGQEDALKEVAKLVGGEPILSSIAQQIHERDLVRYKRLCEEAEFTPLPTLPPSSDKDRAMQLAILFRDHLLGGIRSLRTLWQTYERDYAAATTQLKQVRGELDLCRTQHKAAGNWIEVLAQLKGAVLARRAAAKAGWLVNDLNRANERAIEELMMAALRMFPEEPPAEMPSAAACPSCESPDPRLHPAVQFGGEVRICSNVFHQGLLPHGPGPVGTAEGSPPALQGGTEARYQVQADAFITEMRTLDEEQRDSAPMSPGLRDTLEWHTLRRDADPAYQAQAEAAGPAGAISTQVFDTPISVSLAPPQHLDAEAVRRSQGIALVPAAPLPDDEHDFAADGRCTRCRQPKAKVGDKPCPGAARKRGAKG